MGLAPWECFLILFSDDSKRMIKFMSCLRKFKSHRCSLQIASTLCGLSDLGIAVDLYGSSVPLQCESANQAISQIGHCAYEIKVTDLLI